MTESHRLARLVGVSPDCLDLVRTTQAPTVSGQGFSNSAVGPLAELEPPAGFPQGVTVARQGNVRLLVDTGQATPLEGDWVLEEDGVYALTGPGVVEVGHGGAGWLLELVSEGVRWWRVSRPPPELPQVVARGSGLSVVDWPAVLGERRLHGWLAREVHDRSAPGWDTAAAVGLVMRLWTPAPEDRGAELGRLRRGQPTVGSVLGAWVRARPGEALEGILSEALGRAEGLREDLEDLDGLAAEDPELAGRCAHRLLLDRDDLASVLRVLRGVGRADLLETALAELDEVGVASLSVLGDVVPAEPGPRLSAVTWMEPDAWWAGPWRAR